MPICKIELDQSTYEKLVAVAIREWRPTQWQAEVLLRRAILLESSDPHTQGDRSEKEHADVAHTP